jgi:acyl-CoA synthetase (NDP forming)
MSKGHSPSFGEGFPPKSIAIVGVSRQVNRNHPGYTGLQLFRSLRNAGFQGRVYPVNPKADEIDGERAYPKVSALPERPDLVTVSVPAAAVPEVLEDCAAAGVLNVQVSTSGFAETCDPEAVRLQQRLREIAVRGGIRLVGPNCMGFQVPSVRMRMFDDVPLVEGPVAFVSQSGGHCRHFMRLGSDLGIGFSKVISYGNALVVDVW